MHGLSVGEEENTKRHVTRVAMHSKSPCQKHVTTFTFYHRTLANITPNKN